MVKGVFKTKRIPRLTVLFMLCFVGVSILNGCGGGGGTSNPPADPLDPPADPAGAIIIDHRCIHLSSIPSEYISRATSQLLIAYGHTSHGSQITDGMTGLANWKGSTYAWNNTGSGGALKLRDYYNNFGGSGVNDLANPGDTAWATATRNYLNSAAGSGVNVVMWSWCGGVSGGTEQGINSYLSLMSQLENEFPNVRFIYMTGHLDGTGLSGNLHLRNEQIRRYCRANGKILYDFADIETYNPSGEYFGDLHPNDECNIDGGRNWAIEWQNSHSENVDWYNCGSAHSQPVNANMKAYAAWWLWARLAGWSGN